jgi:hypothetical protein
VVRDGVERGEEHLWRGGAGEAITYTFDADTLVSKVRIVFDSDFNRDYDNMPSNYPLVQPRFHLPKTLVTAYRLVGENEKGECFSLEIAENHQRLCHHTLGWQVKRITLLPLSTNGSEDYRIFSFEVE